jgi:hypothetical protein
LAPPDLNEAMANEAVVAEECAKKSVHAYHALSMLCRPRRVGRRSYCGDLPEDVHDCVLAR